MPRSSLAGTSRSAIGSPTRVGACASGCTRIPAPISCSICNRPVRVGLMPTLRSRSRRGRQDPRHQKKCGRGKIRRHLDGVPVSGWPPSSAPSRPSAAARRRRRQHPLGVITRRGRLGHAGAPLGAQPRQQHGGLHLGAGHRHGVVDALQHPPPCIHTGGRPSCVVMCAPICRSGAATRSMGRRISEASPTSVLAKGWPASSPIDRRMAVPALPMSSAAAAACSPRAAPLHDDAGRSGRSICTPSAAQCTRGRQAVLAGEKAADARLARGDAAQHQRAMRNGFVTRDRHLAADLPPGATWYSLTAPTTLQPAPRADRNPAPATAKRAAADPRARPRPARPRHALRYR